MKHIKHFESYYLIIFNNMIRNVFTLYFPFPGFFSPERSSQYSISKYPDDWFVYKIRSKHTEYIVDGWDGLKSVIEDTFN